MTVAELAATMSPDEERGWVEYHAFLNEERKRAADEAKRQQPRPPLVQRKGRR